MSGISIGKEAYFDTHNGRICYGEAYISKSSKKVHKLGDDITGNALKATAMFLLKEPQNQIEIKIRNKGNYVLKVEKI